MAGHYTVGIIVPFRILIMFGFFMFFFRHCGHRKIINPGDFRHWLFGGERSNHTTATQFCPHMGRCCSWHTSGGFVFDPDQLAGLEIRGGDEGHGVFP